MIKGKKLFRGRRKGNRMLHGRYLAGAMAAALVFTVILPTSDIKAEEPAEESQALLPDDSFIDGSVAESWTDIIEISAGSNHTVGLKTDGTAVAMGNNVCRQCDVNEWTDIIEISAGGDHTAGLKSDGTVVAAGDNNDGQCDVSEWTDITGISAGGYHTIGLKSGGTVVAVGDNNNGQCDVSEWTDITGISAGFNHTVGLKSDGTVVAAGDNGFGECDVSEWTDITKVSAGCYYTVGLKSDGTVVAVGDSLDGKCNVKKWEDIIEISAGNFHTIGLRSDGTVVAVGDNSDGKCSVKQWKDMAGISAGFNHTVGLKSDGTVVIIGSDDYGQLMMEIFAELIAEEEQNQKQQNGGADKAAEAGLTADMLLTGLPLTLKEVMSFDTVQDAEETFKALWQEVGVDNLYLFKINETGGAEPADSYEDAIGFGLTDEERNECVMWHYKAERPLIDVFLNKEISEEKGQQVADIIEMISAENGGDLIMADADGMYMGMDINTNRLYILHYEEVQWCLTIGDTDYY